MRYYRFLERYTPNETHPDSSFAGTEDFALTDPDGTTWWYLKLATPDAAEQILRQNHPLVRYEEFDLKDDVDWGVQWSAHSPDFKDYLLEIDLAKYSPGMKPAPILKLQAGPGFGDLSHPTTRLTLGMMTPFIRGRDVIDVGCGSGILTLAAALLEARSAVGTDIDEDALRHADLNARLNGLEKRTAFALPQYLQLPTSGTVVILMNMIRTQQKQAWKALPALHSLRGVCISSGVLAYERDVYLSECQQRDWRVVEERQERDWLAFRSDVGPS